MIWLIMIAGLILRLISLNQSLWLDEAINVLATQKYSFMGMITEYAKADFHPPGFFIILWTWTRLFGTGEIFVRIPSVIFGVLTVYVIYKLGVKISSKKLGIYCALLLAINPLHIYYSQEARMYALATLVIILNSFFIIDLGKGKKINLFLLTMSNLTILLSDYVAYLIFPAQFIYLLIQEKKAIKTWLLGLGLAALSFMWWVPIFTKQLDVGSVATVNLPAWKFVVGGFDIKTIPLTLVKFIIGRINLADKNLYFSIMLPVCSLFIFLIFKGIKSFKDQSKVLLVSWISIPIILASLISFVIPIYSYFRLLFILPAFIILLSLGIISYKSKLRYIFLGLVLLIQIFSSATYLFNKSYHREDWRGLVNSLSGSYPQLLIESTGSFAPLEYYLKKEAATNNFIVGVVTGLKKFPANDDADIEDLGNVILSTRVYYLEYLVDVSDPKKLLQKKLMILGFKQVSITDFNGVGFLYEYQK